MVIHQDVRIKLLLYSTSAFDLLPQGNHPIDLCCGACSPAESHVFFIYTMHALRWNSIMAHSTLTECLVDTDLMVS